jgi:UDP-N-acetylglucosamine 1-carboxyvinyltransferase
VLLLLSHKNKEGDIVDKLIIEGCDSLEGEISISGAKNAALPILIASLLAAGKHTITNIPNLVDISSTLSLLGRIGAPSLREEGSNSVVIDTTRISFSEAPYDVVRKMRASFLVLGPLLARVGHARVSLPGGCAIGVRPVEQHIKGLEALGAKFIMKGGYIEGQVDELVGASIHLDFPTVGGTENIMMAAALARGITTIENAAREPEVVDLARYLRSMGARITGEGTSRIEIDGVPALKVPSSPYRVMSDRIEAGTYILAAAMTKGIVRVNNVPVSDMHSFFELLKKTNCPFEIGDNWVEVRGDGVLDGVSIETQPHPGFPTDMQAQWMAAMIKASGPSIITEKIFENRFMHVAELTRMGADVQIHGNSAHIQPVSEMYGTSVMATDLRASASLILAALLSEGRTELLRIYHLDRGYENLVQKMKNLGAKIARVSSNTDKMSVEF